MGQRQTQLATLCYIKKDGKTLMLHRIKKENDVHQGKWNGLGGKFKEGETPESCVAREVLEESGLVMKSPKMRGVLTFPNFTPDKDWIVFLFTSNDFSGELIDSSEGKLEWIPDDKLKSLPLWEGDLQFLSWLDQDRFFTAKFIYIDKILKDYSVNFY